MIIINVPTWFLWFLSGVPLYFIGACIIISKFKGEQHEN